MLSNLQRISNHRLFRAGSQMVVWRFGALVLSAAGNIWTARCLGPGKLGISGFILTGVGQATLLVTLPPSSYLVRRYKESDSPDGCLKLVETGTSVRAIFSLIAIVFAAIGILVIPISSDWQLSVFAGIPLIGVTVLNAAWLLQAQEKQPAQYKSSFFIALITALVSIAFIHPGSAAGADVVVALVAGTAGFLMVWHYAGFHCWWKLFKWSRLIDSSKDIKAGLWLYLTGVVMYLYVSLEVPLVGYLVSVEDLGLYRTATVLCAAVNSFLVMIPTLLFPRFIAWQKESPAKLWILQKRLAVAFTIAGAVVIAGAFVLSPSVFHWVYGKTFARAAVPFAMLVTSKIIVALNGVFAWGLWSRGRDRAMFSLMAVTACISVCLNLTLIPRYGMVMAAGVNIASEVIILIGTLYLSISLNRGVCEVACGN